MCTHKPCSNMDTLLMQDHTMFNNKTIILIITHLVLGEVVIILIQSVNLYKMAANKKVEWSILPQKLRIQIPRIHSFPNNMLITKCHLCAIFPPSWIKSTADHNPTMACGNSLWSACTWPNWIWQESSMMKV